MRHGVLLLLPLHQVVTITICLTVSSCVEAIGPASYEMTSGMLCDVCFKRFAHSCLTLNNRDTLPST
ncbi:hypothetical protein EJ04DRAFT_266750 [Polyplosphaeria fusca]|uniref:Secreted protein n=1 Tax=Polyplosphaeria fusca TaxID=682080 RepID=A0A9P4QW01_9PLEO|nr:hypothetical protein EJ04DRAFT_266750 [Polyplosphaeria fusca]